MSLRSRLRKLQQEAFKDAVLIYQQDGSVRAFSKDEVGIEFFLTWMDLAQGEARDSKVFEAVRNATPESRASFEERYRSIVMTSTIVAAEEDGGWVETFTLEEEGTVTRAYYEGGSPEAKKIREEARKGGSAGPFTRGA